MFPVNRLRMRNMFPPDAGLSAPDFGSEPNLAALLRTVLPHVEQQKDNDMRRDMQMNEITHKNRLAEIGASQANEVAVKSNKPMNTVFQGLTPYQSGTLATRNRDIDLKGELGRERLDVTRDNNESKNELGKDKLTVTSKNNDVKNDINQQRANVYKFKTEHPGMKIVIPKGGNITAIDPITGQTMDLGIDSGTMSDKDRLDLTGEQKINEIEKKGETQLANTAATGSNQLANIAARAKGQQTVNADKPTRGLLPTQVKVDQTNKARQLVNQNPDLAGFIKFGEDGSFKVDTAGGGYFGNKPATPDQVKKINDTIYGAQNSNINTTKPSTTQTSKPAVKIPEGRIVVTDKDGKEFHIPAAQLDDAIKQGYKKKVGG